MYSTWIVVQEVELVVAVVSRFLCRHGCGWILNLCVLIIFFGLSNCNCALWGLGMSWVCRVTWLMCKHICMPQWVTYLLCLAVYDNYTRKRIVSQRWRWACHGCGENCNSGWNCWSCELHRPVMCFLCSLEKMLEALNHEFRNCCLS